MKQLRFLLAVTVLLFLLTATHVNSQTTTFILLRHAEKDTTVQGSTTMQADPPLSADGKARAARIPEVLKAYHPDMIYSTNFIRTKSTVTPLSEKAGKEIQVYDHRNLKAFADELLKQEGKTIVVAGHSNTTPILANFLIKENKYKPLDESIYNQYWIITIKDGKVESQVLTY